METHLAHHKLKAEWTRSSTNEALEESIIKQSKNENTGEKTKHAKIKILEQIVLKPGDKEDVPVSSSHSTEKPAVVNKSSQTKKADDNKSKKCQICEKSFLKDHFEDHVKSHGLFECTEPDCFKKFKRKSSLRKHMYIHKGKFKYECEDCKLTFIDKCKYQIHIASKHKKIDQIHQCKECDKTFTSADYLRRHQITHKDEFKYLCSICNQKFKWFTSLQTHSLIHTQNKTMVQCNICFKSFSTQRTLDRHVKGHQNIKYHCQLCKSIVSTRKDNIMRHIRHFHNQISRKEISEYIKTVEETQEKESNSFKFTNQQHLDEIEISDYSHSDEESNGLIIDDSPQGSEESESIEIQQPIIDNRVNVIQSIGNPNKNLQISQSITTNVDATNEQPIYVNKDEETLNNQPTIIINDTSNTEETEKAENEIKLPPKKKAIAKYNPIEHYRKILGLSESNTSTTSNQTDESPEPVFPDHWRKRTSQNFLFRR